ncbi:MAG: hypothetical protein EB014_05545, partial [Actinobacteria bacterium]|nr:hypothetical protein [Actinomycetota bacterium]
MRTIDFLEQGDGAITLIDQRLLPHKKEILTIKTHQELIEAIQTLAVRGAPADDPAVERGDQGNERRERRREPPAAGERERARREHEFMHDRQRRGL